MGLKEIWNDKVNGQDIIDANDINSIAKSVIELEDQKTLLYTKQSLDEAQKNIARSNINAAPIPLIVTVEDGYASHSPTEMYAHTQKGGAVYLYEDDYGYYNTSYGDDSYWWFYYLDVSDDGIYAREYEIQADKQAILSEADLFKKIDAPVQSVNGKTGEVNLSAEDVGALPDTTEIPKTAADVDADPSGTANQRVSEHNVSSESHTDIRLAISTLRDRLNAFLDIDDTTKDQVSEIIALIEDNSELIDSITTSKVSVSDIVNNLSTSVANKPLSAAQGVVLRLLIENIKVPTKVSAFTNDAGYIKDTELDSKVETALTEAKESGEFNGADGEDYVLTDADRREIAEMIGTATPPDYWIDELDTKADAIQQAMERAGKYKSAFLWYTDAHWVDGNSKVSPKLLNYLYMNTPMNKVNFGGDIIGDTLLATREEMKYLYEWRKAIKDLPNHHSVLGNHDMFSLDTVDYEDDNYRYAFMIAPEESADMVMGDGNYYYIDNHCEKTRYLYIAYMTSVHSAMMAQGQFIVDAIKSVPEGWHIVAIAHRWWQYSSSSTPTAGSIPAYEAEILSVFDTYNARGTRSASNYFNAQDFSDAKGKVEFCIGGHIHLDYDFESAGGIPIIITTADANQNRVPDSTVDSGTIGTTTEAAVYGIIADYNDAENTKITVVGVGRGTSRIVRKSAVKPTSISNITYSGDVIEGSVIDKSKFTFTVNYSNGTTDTISGASSASPSTISLGNNTVAITYVEGTTTLTGTVTIVGTAKPVVNLFNKNDPDIIDRGRFNSSQQAVGNYADNQLVTGYIEAKVGDVFTIKTDKGNNANNYTGYTMAYSSKDNPINYLQHNHSAYGTWVWNSDYTEGTLTIPETYQVSASIIKDFKGTTLVRFCVAYYDMDNIIITKK